MANITSAGSANNMSQSAKQEAERSEASELQVQSMDDPNSSLATLMRDNRGTTAYEDVELSVLESGARRSADNSSGLFFKDGQRKIDFVLVYHESSDKEEEKRRAGIRKVYQGNLVKTYGLELEEEVSVTVMCAPRNDLRNGCGNKAS